MIHSNYLSWMKSKSFADELCFDCEIGDKMEARKEEKRRYLWTIQTFCANINDVLNTHTHQQKKHNQKLTDVCLHLLQLCSLIAELASAAANEKGLTFEEAMEDRLCAYARAVAHFPTAVKEVNIGTQFNYYALTV